MYYDCLFIDVLIAITQLIYIETVFFWVLKCLFYHQLIIRVWVFFLISFVESEKKIYK